jgi:hypothetical protein
MVRVHVHSNLIAMITTRWTALSRVDEPSLSYIVGSEVWYISRYM